MYVRSPFSARIIPVGGLAHHGLLDLPAGCVSVVAPSMICWLADAYRCEQLHTDTNWYMTDTERWRFHFREHFSPGCLLGVFVAHRG